MKNNQAFLIALAIIIGAGDRLIAAIESGKSPAVIAITGLVGAAIAVKFLLEQRPEKDKKPDELPSVPNVIVSGVVHAAEEIITDTITQAVSDAVAPKKRTPPNT
jgi:hypothetical protein